MLELTFSVPQDARPPYLRIADGLRTAIQAGHVQPGERLPSSRRLSTTLGVHRHTITAAMDELVAEGWLEAGERRAHRVCAVLPSTFFQPQPGSKTSPFSHKHEWQLVRQPTPVDCGPSPAQRRNYNYIFQSGTPDLRLFPYDELRACVTEALRNKPELQSGYGDPAGHDYFVERLALYLRQVRALSGRDIIVTHGTQEGVYLVAQLLLKPGHKVAVEALGYSGAWDGFQTAGAEIVPITVDADGMNPDALEAAIRQQRIQLIYLTPHHQYPTTVTLPPARRMRIYELASRHRIPIIEDDYDHEFHYRCQPIAPLASTDPCELVIYTSTLSKIMFPSMRIGFMAVPKPLYQPLVNLRAVITRQNSDFLQNAVARWMDNGGFERHLRRMRRTYQERRDALVDALNTAKHQGLPLHWSVPDGGMALWLDCGVDANAVTQQAATAGVFVSPESLYRAGPTQTGHHLRLGFASQTPTEIRAGIARLAQAIDTVQSSVNRTRRRKNAAS